MLEIENGKYYSLGEKTFFLFIVQRSIPALVILFAAFVISLTSPITELSFSGTSLNVLNIVIKAIVVIAFIVEIIGIIAARLEYGVSKIVINDSSLKIISGILSKEEIELPYRRIQSVEIKQSLFQRLFGVGHVVVLTTNDINQTKKNNFDSYDGVIPLMDYPLASSIADVLIKRAEIEKMQIQQKTNS